jgi:hypothetical protein
MHETQRTQAVSNSHDSISHEAHRLKRGAPTQTVETHRLKQSRRTDSHDSNSLKDARDAPDSSSLKEPQVWDPAPVRSRLHCARLGSGRLTAPGRAPPAPQRLARAAPIRISNRMQSGGLRTAG